MSNKVIVKKQPILFNSIDEQRLSYANQLTVKSWNDIINILRVQTNTNTAYIKQLHNWLVGNTGEDITIPENDTSFVEYVLSGKQSLERLDVKNLYVNGKEVALKENVVDLTSTQTITGPKTFSSQIFFNNDAVLSSGTGVVRFGDSSNVSALGVLAYTEGNRYLRPGYHGVMDLGDGSLNGERWRNLYMTGTVYAGEGLSKDGTATLNAQSANEFYTLVTESDIACINYSASPVPGKYTPSTYYFGNGTGVSGMKSGVIYAGNIYQNDKQVANKDDVVDLTSVQTITGAKIFAGTVGNVQTESGVYLGIDENVGAPNANIAITSANTAAYIDMGPPNKDYGFRLIKWNNLNGKYNAELCYGDDGSGQGMATITIPRVSGTMAITSDIPPIDNSSGVSHIGWTQADYNNTRLASINKLAHWNGAYNSTNASNLKYGVGGELAFKSDINNVMQVAEGKTETYVINTSSNSWFNTTEDTITIANTNALFTTSAKVVYLTDLKLGDIVLIKELDVPDRYVGVITDTDVTFYKMETSKVDLDGYALKTDIPKKTSQLTNDSGFLTEHQDISGKADKTELENYLPLSGAKAMTGDLPMKGNNIIFDNGKEETIKIGEEDNEYSMSIRMEDSDYYKGRYRASGFSVGNDYIDATLDISESRFTMTFAGDSSSTITPDGFSVSKEGETYYEDGRVGRYFDDYSKHVEYVFPNKSGEFALKEDIPTKTSQLTNDSNYATTNQLFSKNYNDLTNKPSIPTKTSQLTNNSGFITNAVNNLTNYYLKSETYTKSEVQQLLNTISGLKLEVVTNLPTTNISSNTIYLKPLNSAKENNIYEEYIYVNSKWETIGTTAVDLSNYALKTEIPTKTSQLTNDSGFLTEHQDISGKVDKEEFDTLKDELDNGDFVVSTASFAEADNAGNRIIETYATKTEIPTKISQLEQDVELSVSEEDVMNVIENNAEQTNTLNVGTSATFDATSDDQIPTSKAVAEMVTDAVDNFKVDEFEPAITNLISRIEALESAPRSSGANYNDYY